MTPSDRLLVVLVVVGALIATNARAGEAAEQVTVFGQLEPNVETFTPENVTPSGAETIADLVGENVPNAVVSDTEANPFQEDLTFRGYDASPVLGTAVGLAVYQDGVRINERFGDIVLWDAIPTFALHDVAVVSGSDPLYGLNALGGAVVLDMKDGFDTPAGETIALSSGSWARTRATVEFANSWDNEALYAGVSVVHDGSWRFHSPSDVAQAYGDYAIRNGVTSAGLDLTLSTDFLNDNAAVPVQDDPRAAFSIPDAGQDSVVFVTGHVETAAGDGLSARARAYFRWTDVRTQNGQAFDPAPCETDPSLLCTGDDPDNPVTTTSGATIPYSAAENGTNAITNTITSAAGASAELDWSGSVLGVADHASLGVQGDSAHNGYRETTFLGTLLVSNGGETVNPFSTLLGGPDFNVDLHAANADESVFLENTLALTERLSLQTSARVNFDQIAMTDLEGTGLTGTHNYSSVNPEVTATWRFSDSASAYASAGQSNRVPTPAELSCANPLSPCLFPLSFISDPDLKQVFARTIEAGAEDRMHLGDLNIDLHWDAFLSRNENDILFVSAGPTAVSGFFENVGATERYGTGATVKLSYDAFDAQLNAGFVDATFRSAFAEQSANNPGADTNGLIYIQPGARLPNIPRFSGQIAAAYQVTPDLHVRLTANIQSSRYLRGDEANLQPPLPGFVVFGLDVEYRVNQSLSLYVDAENLFDRRYATFGLYGDPTAGGTLPFTNPRFIVPAPPFGIWSGLMLHL